MWTELLKNSLEQFEEYLVLVVVGGEVVVHFYREHDEAVADEGDDQLGAPVAASANIQMSKTKNLEYISKYIDI